MAHKTPTSTFITEADFQRIAAKGALCDALKGVPDHMRKLLELASQHQLRIHKEVHETLHEIDETMSCDEIAYIQLVGELTNFYASIAASASQAITLRKLDVLRSCVAELEQMYEAALLGTPQGAP